MKPWLVFIAIASFAGPASASWFEFCEIEGQVTTVLVEKHAKSDTYNVTLGVTSAKRAKEHGDQSYTDCHDYVGKSQTISIHIPNDFGKPQSGDTLTYNWSAFDGFNKDGSFAGTFISTHILALKRPSPAPLGS
jgi:hypothetical protein